MVMMLAHGERESGDQARLAAEAAGWAERGQTLLDLGSTSATLATVAAIAGLGAVMHLGHPAQPSHELEVALLAGSPHLTVTGAVPLASQWVWVGRTPEATGAVVVDEAGMRDRRHMLRTMGANPRLVPSRTPIEERMELAGPSGSLVVERSRVPDGYAELPGSARLAKGAPVWYGLVVQTVATPRVQGPVQVWLAFGPSADHRGSLQRTLGVFADADVDLQHLRSHRSVAGPHVFFSSFACAGSSALDPVLAGFRAEGVAHRVLAVIPGESFLPGPEALTPAWSNGAR